MDLLREHYGSDSDGTGGDDNEERDGVGKASQDVSAARRSSCASSVSVGSESGDGRRGGKKRPRPSSATARQQQGQQQMQRHCFVRAIPHTPGNWAGHIFFPLAPSSAGTSGSSKYDATNRVASRRLHVAAEELIENFATAMKDRRLEQKNERGGGCNDEVDDMRVVSHLPPLPMGQDDSSSDDEDDDESSASSDDDSVEVGNRCNNGKLSQEDRRGRGTDNENSAFAPLHISLSRPFYLQQQSISSFVEHVRKVLAPHSPTPVTFDLSNPEILVNDEKTRSFLTIPAAQILSQNAPIIRMIRSIDIVMKRFGQSKYYEEAKIHTSIASVSGDVRDLLAGTLQRGGLEVGGDNRATFMLDRVMLTFGTTKEHFILLEGK